MEVLGHRGSRVPGPENTVGSVDAALTAGADGVEVDVRRNADGELVCIHDPRLARIGGRAVLRSTTRELAARGIPRLDEVVDAWAGRGRLVVEIKNQPGQPDFDAPRERTARLLVDVLRRRGLTGAAGRVPGGPGGVTVSSFDWHAIEAIRDAGVGVATAFLTMPRMSVDAGVRYARAAGHAEVHAHLSAVLRADGAVERARRAGVRLVAWTITSVETALTLRAAGVHGAICDDPAEVVRATRPAPPADRIP